MNELEDSILVSTMVFKLKGEDQVSEGVVVGEVTDTTDGQIEFGFDIGKPKYRVYVRFVAQHLRDLLDRVEADDGQ